MVFLSTKIPIEELQKIKISPELNTDWLLFSREIQSKNLKRTHNIGETQKYLRDYIQRIYFYPMYYMEPLYCYLMSDNYFSKLDLLDEKYENLAAIWNMKRVPNDWKDEEYQRIPKGEQIFDSSWYNEYLEIKFKELVNCNLSDIGINYIVLGGRNGYIFLGEGCSCKK